MSEKEKAEELYERFFKIKVDELDDGSIITISCAAKQCAKIVCDVILNDVMEYWEGSNIYAKAAKIHWQNVLKEINEL